MKCFSEPNELVRFAKSFLEDRLDSLERDVEYCLREPPYAPFPAFLYCFATIDLLGALSTGNAKARRKPTEQSKYFMGRFMSYSKEQRTLLIDIFRHKLVHLAQPNPVVRYEGKDISWAYKHDDRSVHLKLIPVSPPEEVQVSSGVTVKISHRFHISITHFLTDIRDSVFQPGGFLHSLKQDTDLLTKFDEAMANVYDPEQ